MENRRKCPDCDGVGIYQVKTNWGIGDCPTCMGTGLTAEARKEDREKKKKKNA